MKIGKRKVMAAIGLTLIVVVSLSAWNIWGTDGLVAATLVTVLIATGGLGWLVVESQRQVRILLGETRTSVMNSIAGADRSGEEAEQLLRAVQAGFVRSDQTLDTLISEWRQAREEMLSSVVHTVEREIGAVGKEVGLASHEMTATASRVDSAVEEMSSLTEVTGRALNEMPSTVRTELSVQHGILYRQLEALAALYFDLRPDESLPPMRFWAASPDLLRLLHDLVTDRKSRLVVECGSGVSTLIMAYAMRENGAGKVIALEHLESFKTATERLAARHGLTDHIEVVHAPLRPMDIEGKEWLWYSTRDLPDGEIDILFVDGPPSAVGPKSRYPAVPALGDRLAPDGIVVLDDCQRGDEAEIAELWMSEREDWSLNFIGHEKGTALLGKNPPREITPHVTEGDGQSEG